MTKRNRNALVIVTICLVIIGVWAGSIAASLTSAGEILVHVDSKSSMGDNISIRIPAAAVAGILGFLPNAVFYEATEECGEYMPLVRGVCEELANLPDFTLVEVESRHEMVLIRKIGNSLHIDVEDHDETVQVSIPLGIVEKVARKIEKGRSIL